MKLIDVKDTLPVGFIPIQETVDTRESALSMQARGQSPSLPDGLLNTSCVVFSGNS